MLAALCLVILTGYPVTFLIAGLGVLFAFLGWAMGVFDLGLLGALAQRIFGVMTNQVLIAIPLFVLMGTILERSRIAEELLEQMGRLFGTIRGGLAVSVTLVGALLAASTGIVGATVVTMGLIALPAMLRNGYGRGFAAGSVVTAGTLGQIIPPSTMLIILADVMSTAFQQAQYTQGKFSVETISVGQVFAAAILPGLLLVGLYIAYILWTAKRRPDLAPAMPATDEKPSPAAVLKALVPPIVLIVAVLGSILGGIA
ncbi:MAG: TRAP transporter large permease subunit, partial [Geminicoccaceae bacterium]|nr:TRAP transporter large permease subunit [Geminicoccaceae bacterium]